MDAVSLRYAGLSSPLADGLSVSETSRRLQRFAYVERRLMRLLASRIVTIPEREVKALLARLQFEHAVRCGSLRERILELRTNKSKLEVPPDPALEVLFDEAEHLPGSYPFLAVVTRLLKQALHAAYGEYIAQANELADYNGVHEARRSLVQECEHQELLASALRSLDPAQTDLDLAAEWERHLAVYLKAAAGIDGTGPRGPLPDRRSSAIPHAIPHTLVRDGSLPRVWDYVAPPLDEVASHLTYMIGLRLSEINVAEGLAIVLFETPDMPWSFYFDISRHCWDEMRHSLFGEAAAECTYGNPAAVPMRDYEGVFVMEAPPLEQYAVLGLEVEGKNMKYPPGKRQEWEFARDLAKNPLMTTLQDFDWADEVVHVNIARRQLDGWFEGGLKTIGPFAKAGKEHRTEIKHRERPQPVSAIVPLTPADV